MIYKMKFFTMVGGKMDDSCGLDASAVRMVVEFWGRTNDHTTLEGLKLPKVINLGRYQEVPRGTSQAL